MNLKSIFNDARLVRVANSARKSRFALTVCILASALPLCAARVLYLSGTLDGFEESPARTWTLYHEGNGSGGFELNAGTAQGGLNNAWLTSITGWSSVGRSVFLAAHPLGCVGRIDIRPFGSVKLNFEIIDPPTWTYVALKTVTLSGSAYQTVSVGPFVPAGSVFVRVSLLGNGGFSAVRVDNLSVICG